MTTHHVDPNTATTTCCGLPWRSLPDSDYLTQTQGYENCGATTDNSGGA